MVGASGNLPCFTRPWYFSRRWREKPYDAGGLPAVRSWQTSGVSVCHNHETFALWDCDFQQAPKGWKRTFHLQNVGIGHVSNALQPTIEAYSTFWNLRHWAPIPARWNQRTWRWTAPRHVWQESWPLKNLCRSSSEHRRATSSSSTAKRLTGGVSIPFQMAPPRRSKPRWLLWMRCGKIIELIIPMKFNGGSSRTWGSHVRVTESAVFLQMAVHNLDG